MAFRTFEQWGISLFSAEHPLLIYIVTLSGALTMSYFFHLSFDKFSMFAGNYIVKFIMGEGNDQVLPVAGELKTSSARTEYTMITEGKNIGDVTIYSWVGYAYNYITRRNLRIAVCVLCVLAFNVLV
jgi:hypothetical protein